MKISNEDMIGRKFGRLTIIKRVDPPEHKKQKKGIYYLCVCECGNTKIVRKNDLEWGNTKSCGCYNKEKNVKHNLSGSRFHNIWYCMKRRCTDPNYHEYCLYGGRGIKVTEEWLIFENFMRDMYESYLAFEAEYGEGSATLDRIDPDGDYCKENCRWVTQLEQARNRRNNISVVVDGVEYRTLSELAEAYNLNYNLVLQRYHAGKRDLELVEPPKRKRKGVNTRGVQVEVNGKVYESLTDLQRDYPYISRVVLTKRYHKGLRGTDLIAPPRNKSGSKDNN